MTTDADAQPQVAFPCAECGEELTIGLDDYQEMREEAQRHGQPVRVSHAVCPTEDRPPSYDYEISIQVLRRPAAEDEDEDADEAEPTELARFRVRHEDASLSAALPVLARKLEPYWVQVEKTAALMDADLDDDGE